MWILVNKVDDEWQPFETTWRMDKKAGKTVSAPTVYLSRARALAEMQGYLTWGNDGVAEEESDYHLLEIMPRRGVSVERLIMETLTDRMPDIDVDFHGIRSDAPAHGFTVLTLSAAIADIKGYCEAQGLPVYVVPSMED